MKRWTLLQIIFAYVAPGRPIVTSNLAAEELLHQQTLPKSCLIGDLWVVWSPASSKCSVILLRFHQRQKPNITMMLRYLIQNYVNLIILFIQVVFQNQFYFLKCSLKPLLIIVIDILLFHIFERLWFPHNQLLPHRLLQLKFSFENLFALVLPVLFRTVFWMEIFGLNKFFYVHWFRFSHREEVGIKRIYLAIQMRILIFQKEISPVVWWWIFSYRIIRNGIQCRIKLIITGINWSNTLFLLMDSLDRFTP